MPRFMRNQLALLKAEGTYSVDSVPTAAANAFLCRSISFGNLVEPDMDDRNLLRGYMGNSEMIPGVSRVMVEFEIEVAGAGAAGTVPKWDVIWTMSGCSSTNTPGVKQEYLPVTNNMGSATMYLHADGVLHKLLGLRGSVDFEWPVGKIPFFKVKAVGIYGGVTAVANPTGTFTGWQKPIAITDTNTGDISIHGTTYSSLGLSFSQGNKVEYIPMLGGDQAVITDRSPSGKVAIDASAANVVTIMGLVTNATTGAVSMLHGVTAGYKVQFDAPAAQLISPAYKDEKGLMLLDLGLRFQPSAGNDDYKITAL